MATKQAARKIHPAAEACAVECGSIATRRNRYFTGKYLSDRDFTDEQMYHISRRHLHNRLLHGYGVVCGLRVVRHPSDECRTWAVVRAGVAIDCCGREIVLRQDTAIDLATSLPDQPPPEKQQAAGDAGAAEDRRLVLALRYAEHLVEYVPALYDEQTCDPNRREANRVSEVAELRVYRLTDFADYPNEWPATLMQLRSGPQGDDEQQPDEGRTPCDKVRDDCDDELPGPAGICLEPECLLDDIVPLAVITPVWSDEAWQWTIDMRNRPKLRTPPKFLTHIVDYNWRHGGAVTLSKLAAFEQMDGRLKIYFDRPLATPPAAPPAQADEPPADPDYAGTGINRCTFVVHSNNPEGIRFDTTMLFDDSNPPYWDPEACAAVFPINDEWLEGKDTIAGNIIHVTLKCDFVVDCHDLAVDGDHRLGQTPTGDGIEGGTFESWFRVVDDGANARALRREARRKREAQAADAGART